MIALTRKLLQHVLPGVIRPLHILWNQVIGFVFLAIAGIAIPSAVRSYHDPNGVPRLILEIPFILVMAAFGITSFLKARRISRL